MSLAPVINITFVFGVLYALLSPVSASVHAAHHKYTSALLQLF